MFEQATLSGGPLSTRLWSTCAGITGQVLLIGVTVLVPLVFPAALPNLRSYITLEAPGPPPPRPQPGPTVVPKTVTRAVPFQATHGLVLPMRIPAQVALIEEEPPEVGPTGGSIVGVIGSIGASVADAVTMRMLQAVNAVPVAPTRVEPAPVKATPAPAPTQRFRVGGLVKAPIPVSRPQPVYPQIARIGRIEGTVELEGVIGIDGRIHELRVKGGHAFLVQAAMDAVRQWVYTPGTLNGDPVEVITPITVTFHLGR